MAVSSDTVLNILIQARDQASARIAKVGYQAAIQQERLAQQQLKTTAAAEKLAASQQSAAAAEGEVGAEGAAAGAGLDEEGAAADLAGEATGRLSGIIEGVKFMLGQLALQLGIMAVQATFALGKQAVQASGDFQEAMLKTVSLAGLAKDKYQEFSDKILQMAPQVGRAPLDLAKGLYFVLSNGIPASKALDVLRLSARLAAEGMTDTATTSKAMVMVINNMGMTAQQAANFIVKAVADGNTTMDQFAKSIGKLGLDTKMAGRQANETGAALDVLTYSFKSTATAATGLSQLYTQMDIKTSTMISKARSLGIQIDEQKFKAMTLEQQIAFLNTATHGNTEELLKMFNGSKLAVQAFEALSTHGKQYEKILGDLKQAQKEQAEQKAWQTTAGGWNQMVAQFQAGKQALLITIGDAILPVLTKLGNRILPVVNRVIQWVQQSGILQAASEGLSGAIDDVSTGIGKLWGWGQPLVKTLGDLFSRSSDLKGGFSTLASQGAGILRDLLGELASEARQVGQWFQSSMLPAIKQALPGFKSLATAIGQNAIPILRSLLGAFLTIRTATMRLYLMFEEHLLPIVVKAAGFLASKLGPAIQFLSPYIQQAAAAIRQFADEISSRVQPILEQFFGQLSRGLDAFIKLWNISWPYLAPIVKQQFDTIVGMIKFAWATISGIIKIALDLISGNWKQAFADWKGMIHGQMDGIVTMFQGPINQILQKFGLLPKGVNDKLALMKNQAQQKAVETKLALINQSIDMEKQVIAHTEAMRLGLLKQLAETKDPAKRRAIEIKLNHLTQMEQMEQGSLEHSEQMKKGLLDKLSQLKQQSANLLDQLKQKGVQSFDDLKNLAQQKTGQAVSFIGQKWQQGVQTVGGWFNWLYNHNYYWKDLVDFINKTTKRIVDWLTQKWTQITGWLADKWAGLKDKAAQAWQAVSSVFSNAWTTYIAGPLQGLWNNISNWFEGLNGKASGFGSNFLQGWISGFESQLGNLAKAAENAAQQVAKFLGFHSPSKEGPGRDLDKWPVNFVKSYAAGLNASRPMLSAAVANLASAFAGLSANGSKSGGSGSTPANLNQQIAAAQKKVAATEKQIAAIKELIKALQAQHKHRQISTAAYKALLANDKAKLKLLDAQKKSQEKQEKLLEERRKKGLGSVSASGASSGSGSGSLTGGTGSGQVVNYITNYTYNFTFQVPMGTSREFAREVTEIVDRELARKNRRKGSLPTITSGSGGS